MNTTENPYAGQGAVLLDIGGSVGAIVVTMPASTDGLEVELRAADHESHDAGHHHGAHTHVGVVARPTASGTVHSLVYPSVEAGQYGLHPLPDGDLALSVTVEGGAVTSVHWPR